MRPFHSRNFWILVLAVSVAGVIIAFQIDGSRLRGYVGANDPSLYKMRHLGDENHDYALSVREMRKVLMKIIRGTIVQPTDPNERPYYDIDGDSEIADGDVRRTIAVIRDLLTATCGNSVVDSGESCDDGVLDRRDRCNDVCQIRPIWWLEDAGFAGPRDYNVFSESWNDRDGFLLDLPNGRKGLVWGEQSQNGSTHTVYWSTYDPPTDTWTTVQALASSATPLYELQALGGTDQILVAWVEKEYRTDVNNRHFETGTIRAMIYDVQGDTWSTAATLWSAEHQNSALGMNEASGNSDNPSRTLVLSANPPSVLWGDRVTTFTDWPYYEVAFTESTYTNGAWSAPRELGRERAQEVWTFRANNHEPVVTWHGADQPNGCVNGHHPPRVLLRESGVWRSAPLILTNATMYPGFVMNVNASGQGVFAYIGHCETGGYSATNVLYERSYDHGVLGTEHALDSISSQSFRGQGAVSITDQGSGTFQLRWTAKNIVNGVETDMWEPRTYTVTVP